MTTPVPPNNPPIATDSIGLPTDAAVTNVALSATQVALLKGIISQLQNGGTSGTQYTDGAAAPAHPIGTEIAFNNAGTMTAVSAASPLPITGSISASNPSVGTDGSAIPTSSTLLGGSDGTNLQPLQVDGSKNLKVTASSLPLPTGASTAAKQPALGTAGTASSDVLTVQGIASMTALKTDGSAVTQPVSGTFWQTTQPVSGTVTANAGTNLNTSALALETGGNLASAKADLDTIVTNTNKIPASPATEGGHLATIDTVQGATADAAVVGDNNGTVSAKLRGLTKIFNDVWDSTNHRLYNDVSDRWARQAGQVDLARVLGATMSATNPLIDQDQIRAFILTGQSYSATTGKQTSGGAIQTGACLLNNNTAKNILIYSVRVGCATSSVHALNLVTADPAISGVTIAAVNAKAGGAASSVTLEAQNTAVSTAGSIFDEQYILANTSVEFLQNGAAIYLPPNAVNGVLVLPNTSTNVWFVGFKWVEY